MHVSSTVQYRIDHSIYNIKIISFAGAMLFTIYYTLTNNRPRSSRRRYFRYYRR